MKAANRKAAKVFNSRSIASLVAGDSSLIQDVSEEFLGEDSVKNIEMFYERVFARLSKEFRNEYYFKNLIAHRYLLGRHSLKTATMLSEFRVGKSKADCVILNGKSTCYEIKTDYDGLSRLEEQLDDYTKLFDEVYVVCTAKHLLKVSKMVSKSVGILVISDKGYLISKKHAQERSTPIDRDLLCKSLRKDEYSLLAKKLSGSIPEVPNSQLFRECRKIIKGAMEHDIVEGYIEILKLTRKINEELVEILPPSLLNAAISYKLSKKQINELKLIFTK